ncbi:MAG TPA: tRNA lysidine(34) synthetase TilS [Terriglobales bacterium]|nr:tRNA lysidine(34) synthetase TilS [Terriglobales bacterium]
MHDLVRKLLENVRQQYLLKPGDRVGAAVSGGVDSVSLLRLLLELRPEMGIVLSVIHFNHRLRGAESDNDAEFVASLARDHKLPLHSTSSDVAQHASEAGLSIEAAARELRYRYFATLFDDNLDKIATGHTLDDQAETVLLRLIRGTGMRGLRAIQPRLEFQDGEVIRPLLGIRRRELEEYLHTLGQPWRDDSTNRDPKFTRNRVRQLLLPLLEREFNPAIAQSLAELAEIARAEEDYWENEASGWMGTAVQWNSPEHALPALVQLTPAVGQPEPAAEPCGSELGNASLDLIWLQAEPLALQRRVIKAIGDYAGIPLEYKHVEEVLRFAAEQEGSGKRLVLPRGWKVVRDGVSLEFRAPAEEQVATGYNYPLAVPGQIKVPETGTLFQAVRIVPGASPSGYNPQHLFDPERLSKELVVRNWRPGDRFWPAHTKSPKKIKELLQQRRVPQAERKLWPVVVSGEEIAWVRGFPAPARLSPPQGRESVLIREVAIEEDSRQ